MVRSSSGFGYKSSNNAMELSKDVRLSSPCKCRYVTIKILSCKTGPTCIEYMRFGGLLANHPLSSVIGTPAFNDAAQALIAELISNAQDNMYVCGCIACRTIITSPFVAPCLCCVLCLPSLVQPLASGFGSSPSGIGAGHCEQAGCARLELGRRDAAANRG